MSAANDSGYIPDEPPAKMWELLRRNLAFQKAAVSLRSRHELQLRHSSAAESERVDADLRRSLAGSDKRNPFAGIALRWMAFPPLFICEAISPQNPRNKRKSVAAITSEASFSQASRGPFFKIQPHDTAAAVARWLGPEIRRIKSSNPHLLHLQRDEIFEWEWWQHKAGNSERISFNTPWLKTPPPFQRAFRAVWSNVFKPYPVTETEFFKGWNLGRAFTRSVRGSSAFQPSQIERQRAIQFDLLTGKRHFTVPHLFTRKDVDHALEELKRQLLKDLPATHELLGPPEFWKDFIAVDAIARGEAVETGEAIRRHIYRSPEMKLALEKSGLPPELIRRHFQNGALVAPGPGASALQRREWEKVKSRLGESIREVNQRKRPTIKRRVEFMHTLVNSVFPRLNLAVLLAKPQHKRTRKE